VHNVVKLDPPQFVELELGGSRRVFGSVAKPRNEGVFQQVELRLSKWKGISDEDSVFIVVEVSYH